MQQLTATCFSVRELHFIYLSDIFAMCVHVYIAFHLLKVLIYSWLVYELITAHAPSIDTV